MITPALPQLWKKGVDNRLKPIHPDDKLSLFWFPSSLTI